MEAPLKYASSQNSRSYLPRSHGERQGTTALYPDRDTKAHERLGQRMMSIREKRLVHSSMHSTFSSTAETTFSRRKAEVDAAVPTFIIGKITSCCMSCVRHNIDDLSCIYLNRIRIFRDCNMTYEWADGLEVECFDNLCTSLRTVHLLRCATV